LEDQKEERMKKSRLIYVLLSLALLAFISGCCHPPKLSSVAANLKIPQHTNTWCWAASTEMISDYYKERVKQCESSKYVHNKPADCDKGCAGYCPCWKTATQWGCGATINQIKNNWTHWKFKYTYASSSLSWKKLKETLSTSPSCDRSPIQVIWWWTYGGGHVVTAYGYAEAGGEKYVAYYNPWAPDCQSPGDDCKLPVSGGEDVVNTYDAVVSSAIHVWGNSFYKFKYFGL
jgi:hypothetical protein